MLFNSLPLRSKAIWESQQEGDQRLSTYLQLFKTQERARSLRSLDDLYAQRKLSSSLNGLRGHFAESFTNGKTLCPMVRSYLLVV